MSKRIAVLAALVGCLGCGGGAKESLSPRAPTASALPSKGEAPPELSPVAAPEDLILIGRIAQPKQTFETVADWLGLPIKLDNLLSGEFSELAQAVAWDAPIELAGVMDRSSNSKAAPPWVVASVGLTSLDKALDVARAHAGNVAQATPGVYRVGLGEKVSCALAASLGASPARLVCGTSWEHVEELLPYATRGLPTRDLGSNDLHVELLAEPVRRTYDRDIGRLRAYAGLGLGMISLDDPRFDRVLTDLAYGLADELKALAGEVSTVRINARLNREKKALEFTNTLSLNIPGGASAASFTAELIESLGRGKSVPPETFWALPADGAQGAYAAWGDPARFGAVLKDLIELADAYLEHEKVAPGVRRRTRKIFESYAALSSSGVYVSGTPEGATGPVPGLFGWWVGSSVESAEKLGALFDEVKALLADKEFARLLADRLELDPKLLPRIKSQAVTVKGFNARATAFQVELPGALLEKLELMGQSTTTPSPSPSRGIKSQSVSVVLLPDGEHSLIAYASEQKRAVALLEGLRTPGAAKLASVPALQALKSSPAVSGGFWTLESLRPQLARLAPGAADPFARMPNHGRTHCLLRVDVAESAPSLSLVLAGELPRGVFEDVGSVLPQLAGAFLSGRQLSSR